MTDRESTQGAPITQEREDELFSCWLAETNDELTDEWRKELTHEEETLVTRWDIRYCAGIDKLQARIEELRELRDVDREAYDELMTGDVDETFPDFYPDDPEWNNYPDDYPDEDDEDTDTKGEEDDS